MFEQDDFLAKAVLANREFTATKEAVLLYEEDDLVVQYVTDSIIIPCCLQCSDADASRHCRKPEFMPEMSFTEMKVPRRPQWDSTTTAEELNRMEKESFLNWRRDIALYVAGSLAK